MVTLTPKETSLLSDLKEQEKLCIEKYGRYAAQAKDNRLKALFTQLQQNEDTHLQMLDQISAGQTPQTNQSGQKPANPALDGKGKENACTSKDWEADQYLCADALSMEKHVSSVYDTSIFEFGQPELREALNKIQQDEQRHGEMIYQYMAANNMYA